MGTMIQSMADKCNHGMAGFERRTPRVLRNN